MILQDICYVALIISQYFYVLSLQSTWMISLDMMLWGGCQTFHPRDPHGGFHHQMCPFFLLFHGLKCHRVSFTWRPSICFYFLYLNATRTFDILSKVHFNGESYFMVPNRKIVSYAKIVYECLIILEGVKLWRPLIVPIYELRVDERTTIRIWSKSEGVRVKKKVSSHMSMKSLGLSLVLSSSIFDCKAS